MDIKVSDIAYKQLLSFVTYYAEHFSLQAANHLADSFEDKMEYLSRFPETGHPEPLAEDLDTLFRSIRIAKHINVVYCIDYVEDCVKVCDIWDTRMSPERLKRRLTRRRRF